MAERMTLVGTLACSKFARSRSRRGRSDLGTLLADAIAPLPPYEVWSFIVIDETHPRGKWIYQLKSQRLPKCLVGLDDAVEITIKATVEQWKNGAGGTLSRVHLTGFVGRDAVPAEFAEGER